MNIDDFESAARREGYDEVLTRVYPPEYRAGDHSHPFDARGLIVAGAFTISIDGAARLYPAGAVFELPAGTVHQEAAGPDGVTYLVARRAAAAH